MVSPPDRESDDPEQLRTERVRYQKKQKQGVREVRDVEDSGSTTCYLPSSSCYHDAAISVQINAAEPRTAASDSGRPDDNNFILFLKMFNKYSSRWRLRSEERR